MKNKGWHQSTTLQYFIAEHHISGAKLRRAEPHYHDKRVCTLLSADSEGQFSPDDGRHLAFYLRVMTITGLWVRPRHPSPGNWMSQHYPPGEPPALSRMLFILNFRDTTQNDTTRGWWRGSPEVFISPQNSFKYHYFSWSSILILITPLQIEILLCKCEQAADLWILLKYLGSCLGTPEWKMPREWEQNGEEVIGFSLEETWTLMINKVMPVSP